MSEDTLKKLSEPMPDEAIQRTNKAATKKGYDTTGYGYQYCVDRFNDVCGKDWGFDWEIINTSEGTYSTGKPYHSITVKLSIWLNDSKQRSCIGGHTGIDYADTLKGAITNAFKKTAAFWGVGAEAFRGTIDDDTNLPDSHNNIKLKKPDEKQRGDIEKLKSAISNAQDEKALKEISALIGKRTWLNEEIEIATELIVIRRKEIAEEGRQ